jgi:hypothetical protein
MALRQWWAVFGGVLVGLALGAAPRVWADPAAVAGADSTVPYRGTLEASFPWADAATDTTRVDAPRLKVEELLADIGRRQRADRDSLRSVAVTAVVTVVRTPDGGAIDSTGTWSIEQTALRTIQERGRPDRIVRLWERKQKMKDGVLQPAKEKAVGAPRWQPQAADIAADLPFSEGSAARYRYALRASTLVGTSLVHEIDFAPRDRFAPLPSGTIWVDIADWAIRRVAARFADAVPYPWILRGVPDYRLRQSPCGGVWFPVAETARVVLRDLPLVDSGGVYDVRVELLDIVINGEPCEDEVAVAAPDTAEAVVDEGVAFWSAIDGAWEAALPATLHSAPVLAPAQLDSLSHEGERILAAMPSSPPWRLRVRPLAPAYNRAQGFAPRVGLRFGRVGSRTRLDAQGGLGLTDHRAMWGLGAQAALSNAFTFSVTGARETAAFAGDGRAGWRFWSAVLWGGDPNHYYDRTSWTAALAWRHDDDAWLKASAERARELPLGVRTRWNVAGHELSPDGMRVAEALDDRVVRVAGGGRVGIVTSHAAVARHWLRARDGIGDERTLDEWRLSMKAQRLDPLGDRWTLRAGGRGFSGVAPAQLKVWAGDWWPGDDVDAGGGSLCGWPAGTLAGDHGAWASLAVDLNVDPWRSLRVPGLRSLRLQPLVFAEWAGAWGGSAVDGAATGSRADVGLGFSRRVDLPLVGAGSRLEVRAARAVGEGAEGQDWRVVVGIGR